MGSNMQAQAVPLLKTESPLVGTGMEIHAAIDTGDVVLAASPGTASTSTPSASSSRPATATTSTRLEKYMRSNQGTLIHKSRWSTPARR